MKFCGAIAGKNVCANEPYILYSHINGLIAARPRYQEVKRDWEREWALLAERGKECDAVIFRWTHDHWAMCGNLYDIELGTFSRRQHPQKSASIPT